MKVLITTICVDWRLSERFDTDTLVRLGRRFKGKLPTLMVIPCINPPIMWEITDPEEAKKFLAILRSEWYRECPHRVEVEIINCAAPEAEARPEKEEVEKPPPKPPEPKLPREKPVRERRLRPVRPSTPPPEPRPFVPPPAPHLAGRTSSVLTRALDAARLRMEAKSATGSSNS